MTTLNKADYYSQFLGDGKKLTPDELIDCYSEWAPSYDEIISQGIFNGPKIVAQSLVKYFKPEQKFIRIIDIGAGTGKIAEELHKHGFENIDALDPCPKMLEIAKKNDLYNNYIVDFICERPSKLEENGYDAAIMCGVFRPGHIPAVGINELVRVVKPGGAIFILMREAYLYATEEYKNMEAEIDKLEKQGKWKRHSREVIPKYSENENGIIFIYIVQ